MYSLFRMMVLPALTGRGNNHCVQCFRMVVRVGVPALTGRGNNHCVQCFRMVVRVGVPALTGWGSNHCVQFVQDGDATCSDWMRKQPLCTVCSGWRCYLL